VVVVVEEEEGGEVTKEDKKLELLFLFLSLFSFNFFYFCSFLILLPIIVNESNKTVCQIVPLESRSRTRTTIIVF